MTSPPIRIEGYTIEELLALPDAEFQALALSGHPITFQVGTAQVLGQFSVAGHELTVELAHIDGGGDGVLPAIASLAERYARDHCLQTIQWLVYALTCARPNLDLRRILERRGFERYDRDGTPMLRLIKHVPSADDPH